MATLENKEAEDRHRCWIDSRYPSFRLLVSIGIKPEGGWGVVTPDFGMGLWMFP